MSNKLWHMYRGSTGDDLIADIKGPSKTEHHGSPMHAEVYLKVSLAHAVLQAWASV